MKHSLSLVPLAILALASAASAAPLTIDLTRETAPPVASPYGPGNTKSPQAQELILDNRSFFLDGKPWVPILGELHYARTPRSEWRDDLLKMKAGGINTVSTYVFWIHHEEVQGQFDWSGQRSLRDFLKLCQEVGLKAFVRMGPWCHGEARNGGFPDWVQRSGTALRTKDPRFLALVEPFYREQAQQMRGLLWKDGGPVVGVQFDNECDRADYLLALKDMARADGVGVPFYAITGWQGGLPQSDLIPLFGGYSDGFWGGSHEDYRKEYLFTDVRAMNDLGAQLTTRNPVNSKLIAQFPYACVEIGGGMASGYDKRIKIIPANVAALALSKLGNGNNMPGYYMFQGGINPEGKLSEQICRKIIPTGCRSKIMIFRHRWGQRDRCANSIICCVSSICFCRISAPPLPVCRPISLTRSQRVCGTLRPCAGTCARTANQDFCFSTISSLTSHCRSIRTCSLS